MKGCLIVFVGIFFSGCGGKDNASIPVDPVVNIIDTLCTTCNNDSTAVIDTARKFDIQEINFADENTETFFSIEAAKIRRSFFNFLKSNSFRYDNNLMVFLGSKDSTIYCYRQGSYTSDIKLPIMSASKPVTAAVIMTLVEAGKLALDDAVSKYIPSFRTTEKQKITIRQLLSHTSGIVVDSPYDSRANLNLAQAVDSLAVRTKLLFEPGTRSMYCSAAFNVASRVAEVVEMKTWAEIFQDKIGSKCGMEKVIYSPSFPLNPATGSGIVCSMNEYLRFWVMIYNKGTYNGERVLAQNSVETMENDNTQGVDGSYGLGLFRSEIENNKARELACHSAAGIQGWINREKNYYGLLFTQAGYDKTIESNLAFRKLVRDNLGAN